MKLLKQKQGFSAIQTYICEEDDREQIKLEYIPPENIRWDKSAKKIKDLSFIAYKQCLVPNVVKDKYCKNDDGTYNEELCKLIDSITTTPEEEGVKGGKGNGRVVAYQTENSSGLTYNNGATDGIQAGKVVELVVMYLIDTSVYSPNENDNIKTQNLKKESAQVKKTIGSPSLKRSDSGLILFINYQIFLRAAIAGKPR